MMRNLKYTAALVAAALSVACTDDPVEPTPLPQGSDLSIYWDIKGVASSSNATRVIIGDDKKDQTDEMSETERVTNPAHPDFYITLPEICDETKEPKYAIGLFGDYIYTENGDTVAVKDFYRGARLTYLPNVEVKDDVLSQWDTNIGMKYWYPRAMYIFRAYYPQRLYSYTVSTSTATTLAVVYPSRKLQYDLLHGVTRVKATSVETDKDGNKIPGQMYRPVELKMKHALAALRFQFKLNFEDADFLTSVYLLNDEEKHFFSQGTAILGEKLDKNDTNAADTLKKLERVTWKQDYNPPADEILYKWVPPLKYWYGIDEDESGKKDGVFVEKTADEMLKYWGWNDANPLQSFTKIPIDIPEHIVGKASTSNEEGTTYDYNPVLMYALKEIVSTGPVENEDHVVYHGKDANAYYGMEQYYDMSDPNNKKWVTRDPTKPAEAAEIAPEGKLFCRNSGWLLIPPQESFGTLTLCFTTKKGGQTLYKVQLPKETKTEIDKNGEVIVDDNGKPVTGTKDAEGNILGTPAWVAGYRYTYLVTISQSNYEVNVTIKKWNERKHSTEIIF